MHNVFFNVVDGPWEDPGNGQKRKILHMNNLSIMLLRLPKGTVTEATHKHPNEQAAVILSGRARMHVGDAVKELGPGDGYRVPANVPHYIEIIEDAVLADFFSPKRSDLKPTEP